MKKTSKNIQRVSNCKYPKGKCLLAQQMPLLMVGSLFFLRVASNWCAGYHMDIRRSIGTRFVWAVKKRRLSFASYCSSKVIIIQWIPGMPGADISRRKRTLSRFKPMKKIVYTMCLCNVCTADISGRNKPLRQRKNLLIQCVHCGRFRQKKNL